MWASYNHFEIQMTLNQARSASHPGDCEPDVRALLQDPKIRRQFKKISDAALQAELREYGAWSEEELQDREMNEARMLWCAANDISEEAPTNAL